MQAVAAPPASPQPRLAGLDIARALAVFGMVVVNFKIVLGAAQAGPSWLVSVTDLLDGRAAATFVLLAGVGLGSNTLDSGLPPACSDTSSSTASIQFSRGSPF